MTTYFDDCSSLSGWTERGFSSGTQFSISSGTITATGTSVEALSLNAIDSDSARDNCEILIKAKIASFSTTHYFAQVRETDSGSVSTSAYYIVALRSSAIRTYYKVSGGALTQIASVNPGTLSNNTYYWVRLRVNGSSVQARVWADGASEPGTWNCDNTDTNVTGVGAATCYKDVTNVATTWDSVGVGTNGNTAPSSAYTTHAATGVLTGSGAVIVGAAARSGVVTHAATGVVIGAGSAIAGSASRTRVHSSTGVITGQGGTVAGTAHRTRVHATTGSIVGSSSTISGDANRTRIHATTGVLTGSGSVVTAMAERVSAPVTHAASGALVGPGACVIGYALRLSPGEIIGGIVHPTHIKRPGALINRN